MPDLDLRLVRYFTVVAEHEHFGRAAEALHVAQPSLSRQVRRLEDQLGVRLLDRTPQGSRLTPAGRVFLVRARGLLHDAEVARSEARAATREQSLAVGYAGDLLVTAVVRDLRHRFPGAEVTSRHVPWHGAGVAVLDHEVDVVLARTPMETEGLDVEVLYDEPRVLVVPLDHRLAGKESVRLEDFADEVMVGVEDPRRDAFWRVLPRPDGRVPPPGPVITGSEDKFEHVAAGEAVSLMPRGRPGRLLRADLTTVPVEGLEPVSVVVASRAGERSELLDAFRATARTLLTAADGPA